MRYHKVTSQKIPFTIETYEELKSSGELFQVKTSSDLPIRILCTDRESNAKLPIVGLIKDPMNDQEELASFTIHGIPRINEKQYSLFLVKEKEYDLFPLVEEWCRGIPQVYPGTIKCLLWVSNSKEEFEILIQRLFTLYPEILDKDEQGRTIIEFLFDETLDF